jgi:hypothetical protein
LKTCRAQDCEELAMSEGFCMAHFKRVRLALRARGLTFADLPKAPEKIDRRLYLVVDNETPEPAMEDRLYSCEYDVGDRFDSIKAGEHEVRVYGPDSALTDQIRALPILIAVLKDARLRTEDTNLQDEIDEALTLAGVLK